MTGTVNRVEPRAMILDMGKGVEGILATTEQSPLEHYRIGQNVKAYVLEVRRTPRGPALFVSRTHKGFLKRLFELEVPEIHNGTVEIRAIAREAGSRSKVAVASRQDGLDPSARPSASAARRVQSVVAELGGEKIDVIPWNDDPSAFVANALSPAQVLSVDIDQEHRIANVTVPERMLSLAIGREGQNARLAARLTGWRIDIRSDVSVAEAKAAADKGRRPSSTMRSGRGRESADRARQGRKGRKGRRRRPRPARPRRPPPTARPARRAGRRWRHRREAVAATEAVVEVKAAEEAARHEGEGRRGRAIGDRGDRGRRRNRGRAVGAAAGATDAVATAKPRARKAKAAAGEVAS